MQDKRKDPTNNDTPLRPDPETLHTTDPQENMEGPVSSLMHKTGEGFDAEDKTKEEADEEKNERM